MIKVKSLTFVCIVCISSSAFKFFFKFNDASKLVGEYVSKKDYKRIFHATSWNIPNIFICRVEIIYDVVKYSTFCHGIFYHITCMICWGINNDLLTLNMDLVNIVVDNNIMWRFEVKRKYIDAYYHSWCN